MAKTYSVTFRVTDNGATDDVNGFAQYLEDLLTVSVLPALEMELVPLTFEVKKGRK